MPERLTFDTQEDIEIVFNLISQFRAAALEGKYNRVVLAQDNIEQLAPEVAIMFLAELQRCHAYCSQRKILSGTYPRNPRVAELLTKLGFYDALNVEPPYDHRTFISVVSGHKSEAEVIDKLLSCFDSALRLSAQDKRNLHVAILECMDNVYEHAYVKDDYLPYLYREWWLVGFADQVTRTVSFIFFDQGYGIVKTIKTWQSQTRRATP